MICPTMESSNMCVMITTNAYKCNEADKIAPTIPPGSIAIQRLASKVVPQEPLQQSFRPILER